MVDKKWLVINIKAPENAKEKEDFLIKIHADIISGFKTQLDSWHFLWEGAPFKQTLLIRFFGNADLIAIMEKKMKDFIDVLGIECQFVENYPGETKAYGNKGWDYIMKVLHLGSDFAIDVLEGERKGTKEEVKLSVYGSSERWVHLFSNQLATRINEDEVLFSLSIHRTAIYMLGEKEYQKISQPLQKEIFEFLVHPHDEKSFPLITSIFKKRYPPR